MDNKWTILIFVLLLHGCGNQKDLAPEQVLVESYVETASTNMEGTTDKYVDSIYLDGRSVVFYAPTLEQLDELPLDKSAREGLHQAVGDFAYYASLVSDSLKSSGIPVYFTDKRHVVYTQGSNNYEIDRDQSGSLIGLILYDGLKAPKILPGMQTHLSLLAAVSDYFFDPKHTLRPLLDYFEEIDERTVHIYSSHSDILNQTGNKLDPSYYPKFGASLANRASKFRMSMYAYHKIPLQDSLTAIICRVPSRYDESSVKMYIWDNAVEMVVDEIELAENVWNDNWIMVQDSWITLEPDNKRITLVQRKKEARMNQGERTVVDRLYKWHWKGSKFVKGLADDLSVTDYPLKDWDSYQEPKAPTEITIIDEDYVWLPLETGDLTWENIILELPKPYSIKKEPIQNQLATSQIDTLITISQPNVNVKFYRTPENNIVLKGDIKDATLKFKRGLKIGVSKNSFVSAFETLNPDSFLPDLVKVTSKNHDRVMSYYFQNDTLVRIEFTNFIH